MTASRNFGLDCINGVVMAAIAQGTTMRVIAGEACTELGCDGAREAPASWLERWMRSRSTKPRRPRERKDHGIGP